MKQISIAGIDDKREMTSVLAVTASGVPLPPQLLYQGKTDMCHPDVNFPADWDIHHSANHWSNGETMPRYLDKVIIPYVEKERQRIGKPEQAALCIFDVFRPHQDKVLLDKLKSNNINYVFVPAGCTGELQPLDITVNKFYKDTLKRQFEHWYSSQVEEEMKSGVDVATVKVDLRLGTVKPIHAGWLMKAHQELYQQKSLIKSGFEKAGIIAKISDDDTSTTSTPLPLPDIVDLVASSDDDAQQ